MPEPTSKPSRRPGGNVVLDLFVTQQRLGSLLAAALAGQPLSPADYAVYSDIAHGPTTPKDLSARLEIPMSTLSGYLAQMQARGHIERVTNPKDRRSVQVQLTDSGRQSVEACRPHFRAALRAVRKHLDRDPAEVQAVLADLGAALVSARDDIRRA